MSKERMGVVVRVRLSHEQHTLLVEQAKKTGLNLSELLRDRAFNKKVICSTDIESAFRIDQIGRMLKHYYPKDKEWSSDVDRKKWWKLAENLREMARDIRLGIGKI